MRALGESTRIDEDGEKVLGPLGFVDDRVDTQLFASIVKAQDADGYSKNRTKTV